MDVRTIIRAQSLLFTHNSVFFERRHHDLLKLQKFGHTIELKSKKKEKEDGGSLLLGTEDDPTEEKTLQRFLQNIDNRSLFESEENLSPRTKRLHKSIFPKKQERKM